MIDKRTFVYYSPTLDDLFTLESAPPSETEELQLFINDTFWLSEIYYIGEL